jgi:PAS domain-containing protein
MLWPIPAVEAARLSALLAYDILDTPAEPSFDRLAQLAATLFDVPIALVGMMDSNRQWFKACIGLSGTSAPRDTSFCTHAILSPELLVIPDATQDVRFADNPAVTGPPFVRFYAGAPLRTPAGHNVGTLCIVDVRPRTFSDRDRGILGDLAALVVDELEARLGARARFLLDKVTAASPNYIYVVAVAQREIVWANRNLAESLGYAPDDTRSVEFRTGITHPDDRLAVAGRFVRFHTMADRELLETSYRLRHADGGWWPRPIAAARSRWSWSTSTTSSASTTRTATTSATKC